VGVGDKTALHLRSVYWAEPSAVAKGSIFEAIAWSVSSSTVV